VTAEYAHDLGSLGAIEIRGLIFADAGSVWSLGTTDYSGGTIDDSLIWRTSVGIGVSMATAHGSFEVYMAEPLKHEVFDETQSVTFPIRLRF